MVPFEKRSRNCAACLREFGRFWMWEEEKKEDERFVWLTEPIRVENSIPAVFHYCEITHWREDLVLKRKRERERRERERLPFISNSTLAPSSGYMDIIIEFFLSPPSSLSLSIVYNARIRVFWLPWVKSPSFSLLFPPNSLLLSSGSSGLPVASVIIRIIILA